jgi:hypothetical protein
MLWPERKNTPLLEKRGIILSFAGIIFATALGEIAIGQKQDPAYMNYSPNPLLIINSLAAVFLLIWLAHRYKDSRISTNKMAPFSPFVFGTAGFLFIALNIFIPSFLAGAQVPETITLLAQFIFVTASALFVAHQVYNKNTTRRHIVSLIFGSTLFWIFLAPIYELNGVLGMSVVGVVSLILLVIWRRAVLKNKTN